LKLILIADLHFGSVPAGLAESLADAIAEHAPELIVVAGDLTLRARAQEFQQARAWLAGLKSPYLILPGNHDLPYVNLFQRFYDPFKRFRLAVEAADVVPVFSSHDACVVGFNTTSSWQPHLRWQEGVARRTEVEAASKALSEANTGAFKAVASHHPLVAISALPHARPVWRARLALDAFSRAGVDLIMSGHLHRSYAFEYPAERGSIVAIGAPTALSWRMRGEPNGFWLVDVASDRISARLWLNEGSKFRQEIEKNFVRGK
jgi:3',5'-cyclic AMP phosphodiesterase CpdA